MENNTDPKEERATLISLRNTMDKIGGNLYEAKADLQYIVQGKSKSQEDEAKAEDRQAPTLETIQSHLDELLGVAHDCQSLVTDIRS